MFGSIKKRFLHRFIFVDIQDSAVTVYIYDVKNGQILAHSVDDFTLENKDELSQEAVIFINKKQEQLYRSYVVTLVNSQGQGIIPTCSATEFKNYSVDRRYIYNICVDNRFTNFVSKIEINWLQKFFAKSGIDLIFSPFVLLKQIVDKKEISTEKVLLYILYYNQKVTLLVKEEERYIYGDFFISTSEENPLHYSYEGEDEVDEDEFEIEDEFEFDDDEFEFDDNNESISVNDVELIEESRGFVKHLSRSLKEFYSSDKYDSDFIDEVKIYADDKIDSTIIEYMENELFLSTKIEFIDLGDEIVELCQKEVFGV